jgi:formylglycine-generating enzyme required for sulfatase activity
MEFVWIEPGTFTMGSPESEPSRRGDEGPQHEVTISRGFWLGRYEITQGQWQSVMGTTPWSGQDYVQENPTHPAVFISWDDVQELVGHLNEVAGLQVYRLATEAEWEYACRAGTSTMWSFGDDEGQLGDYAWYFDNAWEAGLDHAQPVGTKLPNSWGLYDMHGNVWEWVQDWHGGYLGEAQVDPQGRPNGVTRMIRGGGSFHHATYTRSAERDNEWSDYHLHIGARLVRVGPPPTSVTPHTWGEVKAPSQP